MNDLLTGGLSAIISRTATAPLELFKIQRQNSFMPFSTLRAVLQREGVSYLWKGNATNCMRAFPQFAITYAVYERNKVGIFADVKYPALRNFLCGATGGMTAMASIYPLETARSRLTLQSQKSHYASLSDALRQMRVRDMYRGLGMSILGFGPYNAFCFMFYHEITPILERTNLNEMNRKLLAGGLAGVGAVSLTYPTDLVRRRLQLQGFDKSVPQYNGIRDCVRKIVQREGFRGLYRGLFATYIKLFPTTAIQFWVIEKCNHIFKNKH